MAKKSTAKKSKVKKAPAKKVELKANEFVVKKPVVEVTWRDMVRAEASDLKQKMVALKKAIAENKVPLDEVSILNEQHKAMHAYYVVLNTRLSKT